MTKCPKFREKAAFLWGIDYYCDYMKKILSDDVYRRFCRDNYKNCSVYIQNNKSSCYLTTITCNILNKDDNDCVLKKLRDFRNNVLQKDEKYFELLKNYDTIGPLVAYKMGNDDNNYDLAVKIYKYLEEICNEIDNKEYDLAVNKYYVITYYLILYYGLTKKYWDIKSNNYGYNKNEFDIKNSGHGKRRVKINNE